MENIENILKKASVGNVEIPPKIEYRIKYTLNHKNKKRWKNYLKKAITVFASLFIDQPLNKRSINHKNFCNQNNS